MILWEQMVQPFINLCSNITEYFIPENYVPLTKLVTVAESILIFMTQ